MDKNYAKDFFEIPSEWQHFKELDKYFVMEDGETILRYDVAAKVQDYYNPDMYEYIGKGVICWIDGMPQDYSLDNPDHVGYFFRRKVDRK